MTDAPENQASKPDENMDEVLASLEKAQHTIDEGELAELLNGQAGETAAPATQPQVFHNEPLSPPPGAKSNGAAAHSPAGLPNGQNMGILLDVPLQITVELGRASMPVKRVIELGRGSVIELDRVAGEPVDILVNDRLIGYGEVVVVDDKFGVRITKILANAPKAVEL